MSPGLSSIHVLYFEFSYLSPVISFATRRRDCSPTSECRPLIRAVGRLLISPLLSRTMRSFAIAFNT